MAKVSPAKLSYERHCAKICLQMWKTNAKGRLWTCSTSGKARTWLFQINDMQLIGYWACGGLTGRTNCFTGIQVRSQPIISGGQPDFWEGRPRVDIPTHVNRLSNKPNVLSFNYFTWLVTMYNNWIKTPATSYCYHPTCTKTDNRTKR